jgi:outer membrane protein OmpA-like peptidoglycan-associated protein
VHVKIGGYTHNTGNAESNLRLSASRASNVMESWFRSA